MAGTFSNSVYPDKEQLRKMQDDGPAGPIVMVNLLKFRDQAVYADGRATTLTGREAYDLYARDVGKLIIDYGGEVVFAGDTTFLALGEVSPLWDEVALALYPNRQALFNMSTSPEWIAMSVHRQAGLDGQLNIETTPHFLNGKPMAR